MARKCSPNVLLLMVILALRNIAFRACEHDYYLTLCGLYVPLNGHFGKRFTLFAKTKTFFREEIKSLLKIITCDTSVYTMDHSGIIACNFMEISIDLKRMFCPIWTPMVQMRLYLCAGLFTPLLFKLNESNLWLFLLYPNL